MIIYFECKFHENGPFVFEFLIVNENKCVYRTKPSGNKNKLILEKNNYSIKIFIFIFIFIKDIITLIWLRKKGSRFVIY